MVVLIKDFVNGNSAISYEDGKKCFEFLSRNIEDEDVIVLDFTGIEFVITAFLNPVIGDLILNYGSGIMSKIKIVNANTAIIEKIKLVKDGALLKREDMNEE